MNLDLMVDYGCESWKRHNEVLQQMASATQKQLSALKKDVQEVNIHMTRVTT